jgi:hypothetical protein
LIFFDTYIRPDAIGKAATDTFLQRIKNPAEEYWRILARPMFQIKFL